MTTGYLKSLKPADAEGNISSLEWFCEVVIQCGRGISDLPRPLWQLTVLFLVHEKGGRERESS